MTERLHSFAPHHQGEKVSDPILRLPPTQPSPFGRFLRALSIDEMGLW
jgi:hypothetical protein